MIVCNMLDDLILHQHCQETHISQFFLTLPSRASVDSSTSNRSRTLGNKIRQDQCINVIKYFFLVLWLLMSVHCLQKVIIS